MTTPTSGADVPAFSDLPLPEGIVRVLADQGITTPVPIQAMTIDDAMAGRDICAKAPTGSGKTLAFAVPLAATVQHCAPKKPQGLVLAPTRELAQQIADVLGPLLKTRGRRVGIVYGGIGYERQRKDLRRGVDVVVACPGRLEDLMQEGTIRLSEVRTVVLDEADRMADMGFLPAVRRILDATSPDRQTLLFSATLDGDVDTLVRRYLRNPVRHEVIDHADDLARVTHSFHHVADADRPAALAELAGATPSSIVFVRTKHGADRVAAELGRAGIAAQAIHGGRSQSQRTRALAAFRAGRVNALVATDVAAPASTSTTSRRSSTTTCPRAPRTTCTGRAGRPGAARTGGSSHSSPPNSVAQPRPCCGPSDCPSPTPTGLRSPLDAPSTGASRPPARRAAACRQGQAQGAGAHRQGQPQSAGARRPRRGAGDPEQRSGQWRPRCPSVLPGPLTVGPARSPGPLGRVGSERGERAAADQGGTTMEVRDTIYINGAWVPSTGTGTLEVIDSATEEVFGTIPEARPRTSTRPSRRPAAAFPGWSATSVEERAKL